MMSRNILKSAAAFIILAALVATIQAAPTADKLAGQQQQQTDASDTREFQLFGDDQRPSPLRRQQQLLSNYEQDIAALVRAAAAAKRQQVRIQRSLASQASQQASLVPVQRLFEDEQEFKRQLPDLIAQARNDKSFERALLRMLINVSLRGSGNNNAARQDQQQQQDGFEASSLNGLSADDISRLQQINNLDDYPGGGIESYNQQEGLLGASQQPNQMIKREFTAPCGFNAVSCQRSTLRRIQK